MLEKTNIRYACEHAGVSPQPFTTIDGNHFIKPYEKGEILWYIHNFTPDQDKYKTILAMEKAFKIWQPYFHPIQFNSTKDPDKAHILIFFASTDGSKGEKAPQPFEKGVLAYGFAPSPRAGALKSTLWFNEAWSWADMHRTRNGVMTHIHLLSVALHELGHCFNIGHSEHEKAIMFASYNGEKTEIHWDDAAAVEALYSDEKRKLEPENFEEKEEEEEYFEEETDYDNLNGCQAMLVWGLVVLGVFAASLSTVF